MKVTKIIVVPHVHWDREWYFTSEESQVLAVRDFGEVLDHLEDDPSYPSFVLDGQMAVVDEFIQTVPGARDRMARLVAEGRLQVGPWFTQTDQMVVSGESIVRNLMYGMESARKLGRPMMVGYVPDSFGQSAQMPMILNQFGIHRYVFWRGQSEFCGTSSNQFWWKSADDSRVLANQMPLGYATGKYLSADVEALHRRLDRLFALMDEISPTPYAILPNGHDQMPIQTNINEVLRALREAYPDRDFVLGSFDDELNMLETASAETELPEVHTELIDGKRERVHRSIYSVRSDNKVLNTRCENLLTRRVEPLLAVADAVGLDCPRALVDACWKQLLENQAHDSMGGCCSDKVNAEIKSRYTNVLERGELLNHYYQRYIAEAADVDEPGRLAVFNMSTARDGRLVTAEVLTQGNAFELLDAKGNKVPYDIIHTNEVDPGLVDRQIVARGDYRPFLNTTIQFRRNLPAVGYEVLQVHEVEGDRPKGVSHSDRRAFTTDDYRVTVNNNGTLEITTRGGANYREVLGLEIEGNNGDEYDFDPVRNGEILRSADMVHCEPIVTEGRESIQVEFDYTLELPATLDQWVKGAPVEATKLLGVNLTATFDKRSPTIGVDVKLNNRADDVRVRMIVQTGIASKVSYASNQFGTIERPTLDQGMQVWQAEGWSERPDVIFPFLDYVALADASHTVAVLTNGPREYEVTGNNRDELAITLLSCTGVLGKPDLHRRPGRPSGISVPTPDAQCHGITAMQIALLFTDDSLDATNPAARAAEWLAPVDTYQRFAYVPIQLSKPSYKVPSRYSLFSQTNPYVVLSAVKKAQDGNGYAARFYNPSSQPQRLCLEGVTPAEYLTLSESEARANDIVAPDSVITVRIN